MNKFKIGNKVMFYFSGHTIKGVIVDILNDGYMVKVGQNVYKTHEGNISLDLSEPQTSREITYTIGQAIDMILQDNSLVFKCDEYKIYYNRDRIFNVRNDYSTLSILSIWEKWKDVKFTLVKPQPKKITYQEAYEKLEGGNICTHSLLETEIHRTSESVEVFSNIIKPHKSRFIYGQWFEGEWTEEQLKGVI